MLKPTNAGEERRRTPRFRCGCDATISRVPLDGKPFPGKILDLSLGGCCLETAVQLHCGGRIEIVARVKAASFRGVGEVRAVRSGRRNCVAFVHLSSNAREMLANFIAQLQEAMNTPKPAGREKNP